LPVYDLQPRMQKVNATICWIVELVNIEGNNAHFLYTRQ
jgi:hypothetical protein